jgi:DNA-binding transcriptional MocR family regulator
MTIEPQHLAGRTGPRYRALADALAEATRDGRLRPGTKLPTQRELALRLGITVGTVGRAYALAEQRGLPMPWPRTASTCASTPRARPRSMAS